MNSRDGKNRISNCLVKKAVRANFMAGIADGEKAFRNFPCGISDKVKCALRVMPGKDIEDCGSGMAKPFMERSP